MVHDGLARATPLHPPSAELTPRTVEYVIAESVEKPGFFDLWRVVRRGDREDREIIDRRCTRAQLEMVKSTWEMPGGWVNFF